ncbi:NAD(P)/FAD-dependent oxidoreductase [Henriciella aquimarina]|uniref:NAD(P)/FAD-dependent oxidoreductase n=1 Tax=Henriciella aquimarina TaxID=545261 RepID=UPI000A025BCD|nr:NAD(P)/FAD-dependent oxidoreductase [Henriciella aquimarina]
MTHAFLPHRRSVLTGLAGTAAMAAFAPQAFSQTSARLVVVGGGFGGATAARFLKTYLPNASVTLIEPNAAYHACPFSNLVIAGLRDIEAQRFGYDSLRAAGIEVVAQRAIDVDPARRTVSLEGGGEAVYDKLVLSPGIDIRWGALEGYDEAAAEVMPHAWKAGPQTTLLRQQLEAMEDGGLVVMSAPAAPFRCPPGPYERASLIAHYLKTQKPNAKLLILDAKDVFSKKPLFLEAWAEHYPEHLEWRGAADFGRVVSVDPASMTLSTDFEDIQADVANVIPPQKAGEIAERAGVADETGWCPINGLDFSSPLQKDIHVIGDATIAAPMPKSAFSANLQGKLCAMQIARILSGLEPQATVLANTCYSYVTPDAAVSITGVYGNEGGTPTSKEGAGGLSPEGAPGDVRQAEAAQAEAWFQTITAEVFGG